MKSIRKDIVIDHDSLESLRLEKLILLQVDHPFIISMEYVFSKAFRIYFLMEFIQYYLTSDPLEEENCSNIFQMWEGLLSIELSSTLPR